LWNTESHKQIGQPLQHTTHVFSVAISPNGELLLSGDYNGNIQLWSIENILSAILETDSSYYLYLAHRSKVKLGQNLYAEALSDAEKVIELNPTSYLGYKLRNGALHGAQGYDNAFTMSLLTDRSGYIRYPDSRKGPPANEADLELFAIPTPLLGEVTSGSSLLDVIDVIDTILGNRSPNDAQMIGTYSEWTTGMGWRSVLPSTLILLPEITHYLQSGPGHCHIRHKILLINSRESHAIR
jgi:hypothetical protein